MSVKNVPIWVAIVYYYYETTFSRDCFNGRRFHWEEEKPLPTPSIKLFLVLYLFIYLFFKFFFYLTRP